MNTNVGCSDFWERLVSYHWLIVFKARNYWSFFSQKSVMVHIIGVSAITRFPQCESSVYFIKGAILVCRKTTAVRPRLIVPRKVANYAEINV